MKDHYPRMDLPNGKGLSWEEGYMMARQSRKTGLSKMKQDAFIADWLEMNRTHAITANLF